MSSLPQVVTTKTDLRTAMSKWRAMCLRVGVVPTMGALHEGHLSLVLAARSECDVTVATIFVNPTQFAPHEDLAKYPRTLEADLNLLAREKTDLVFVPANDEMFPANFSTFVDPPRVALQLEGRFRPNHFRGVATVVLKLFQLVDAQVAYFGQKDFQQCLVVRHMVSDLNVPIEIRICPIVREPDGLAMSSRNRFLSPAERQQALAISRSLDAGSQLIERGERLSAAVRETMRRVLREDGIERVDYIAVADPESLIESESISFPVVLLIAAFVGQTRLIDNRLVG